MSRIQNSGRSAIATSIYSIVNAVMGFFVRIAFLKVLGENFLGLNGLFSSLLGVLSFADLGLSASFTACLYKPVALNDEKHIAIILNEFKKVYTIIVLVVSIIGLSMVPFLRSFVSGADFIATSDLIIYYLVFLTNILSSYFLVYKTSFVFAKQESYMLTIFDIIFNIASAVIQFLAIVIAKSYLIYLITGVIIMLFQKITINIFINKHYPLVKVKTNQKLLQEDKSLIKRNIKATLVSKFGGICVGQVDNILISAGINIATTGLMSNYTMIKGMICYAISNIQNSITAAMGDLINKESRDVQTNVFNTYMMFNSWIVGFAMCGIGVLSTPFISLIFGERYIVDGLSVILYSTAMYFAYQTYALNVLPTVAGRLDIIMFHPLIEGLSNVVISVVGLRLWGLPGIFFGTLSSQVINYILRPIAIFNNQFNTSSKPYFKQTLKYFTVNMFAYTILLIIRDNFLNGAATFATFFIMGVLTVVVYVAIQFALLYKDKYFKEAFLICLNYIKQIVLNKKL